MRNEGVGSGFDWAPQGSDGAYSPGGAEGENMRVATQTFKTMVLAVDDHDMESAQSEWDTFCNQVDADFNPYGLLACVAVIYNAYILRAMCGDPNPTGPPQGHLNVNMLAIERTTGSLVDSPLEDFAVTAITHAANWQWTELNNLMLTKLEQEDTNEFLYDLAACLMSMFIGVGGIEAAGWREADAR